MGISIQLYGVVALSMKNKSLKAVKYMLFGEDILIIF